MRLSREPRGCPTEEEANTILYMNSGPEMIDDRWSRTPLFFHIDCASGAVWHLPFYNDQYPKLRRPSRRNSVSFPEASIFPRFPRLLWKDSTIRRIQKLSDSGGRISGLSTTLTQRGGIREQPRSRAQGHGRVVFLTFNHDYIIKLNMPDIAAPSISTVVSKRHRKSRLQNQKLQIIRDMTTHYRPVRRTSAM